MKYFKALLLLVSLLMISQSSYAELSGACKRELWQLVVPPLKGVAMRKKDIRIDVDDVNDSVYSVRLFVVADSPDNLDKQVSIGWVRLDVSAMKVFDITNDPDNNVALGVNKTRYRHFVTNCLSEKK